MNKHFIKRAKIMIRENSKKRSAIANSSALNEAELSESQLLAAAIVNELSKRWKDEWYKYLEEVGFDVETLTKENKDIPTPQIPKTAQAAMDIVLKNNAKPDQETMDNLEKMSDSQLVSYAKGSEVKGKVTSEDLKGVNEMLDALAKYQEHFKKSLTEFLKSYPKLKQYYEIKF